MTDPDIKLIIYTDVNDEVVLSVHSEDEPLEEVVLSQEQVEQVVQQLGAWLGEKKL